ncbi:DUF3556 domain-containing protein [Amycolatopsis sp. MJM2582]|uniref:DUF3556 domain-containing protein n=1 Tax=Amycolatopsis sp. MJM2582 TaxID=1427749 RepID=UPI00068D8000|nr:DUF3556 domain-containing protein [Amycolatopsis sp. MJM2582]
MGFKTGDFPPVDPARLFELPYLERIKVLSRHWVEYGFGTPKMTHVIYLAKLLVVYVVGGLLISALTSGLNPLEFSSWWTEPIFYQKLILWTVFLEALGAGGSWGPLAGHFKPFTCGWRTYLKVDTIRQAPWKRVPLTGGDRRTGVDVLLYAAVIAVLLAGLLLPGTADADLTRVGFDAGRVMPAVAAVLAVLMVTLGLRDKVFFLQARGEQYLPAIIFFAAFPVVDMIVALKVLIVAVWFGAGFSKFGKHFSMVVPPMVSNTPWLPSKAVKRMHYKDFPRDLRPSYRGSLLAHVGGTFVEIVTPLVLLFTVNATVALLAAGVMVCFHLFITSTFPLAVPLEWNILFAFAAVFLFLGHPNWAGYGLGDMDAALLALTVVGVLFFPVLGNLRPDLVSFLPSMRQYAGNWASAMWAFAPGAEDRLDQHLVKPSEMTVKQLSALYGPEAAEVVMHQLLGWRAMHSQGRALNSIMINQLGADIDHYTLREAEFSTNCIIGFNFGDGHMHDARFIESLQRRCGFRPGEFVVVWIESQPVHRNHLRYQVIDAALGVVERGVYRAEDAVAEQPWLPNGPIAVDVQWRMRGYERVRYPKPATDREEVQR